MRIVCISDTHNLHEGINLPDGDILIHAGDFTARGTLPEIEKFLIWFGSQTHKYKLLISGNHDIMFDTDRDLIDRVLTTLSPNVIYLRDSGVEIAGEFIWGSPWVKGLPYWAFGNKKHLRQVWALIPENTTILITHMPAWGHLDNLTNVGRLGSESLAVRVHDLHKLKLHVFGHIHEGYGMKDYGRPIRVNAAQCSEPTIVGSNYIQNTPIVVEI